MVPFSVRRFLSFWLPVLAWMAFIFIGSTDLMSAAHTSRFIGPFLRWFAPDIADTTIASVQLIVRKCGHLTEYAVLAALLFRAFRQHLEGAFWPAFLVAALYAGLDEFHQSFVATRTGSPWDTATDCAGAFVGVALCAFVRNRKSRIENRK